MSVCNPLGYDRRAPSTKRTYIILPGLEPLVLLPFLRFLAAILLATFGFPLLSSPALSNGQSRRSDRNPAKYPLIVFGFNLLPPK